VVTGVVGVAPRYWRIGGRWLIQETRCPTRGGETKPFFDSGKKIFAAGDTDDEKGGKSPETDELGAGSFWISPTPVHRLFSK
jgi:hypothetical protein